MFSFRKSITIGRTPHEIFKFLIAPANMPQWRDDVIETKSESTYLKLGAKYQELVNFGEPHIYTVELVDVVPDAQLVFKVLSGDSYHPLREFWLEEEGEHTKLTVQISAHTDGFTRLIQPISSNMFSLKWETYLFQLKSVLEQQSATARPA